jgi:DNA mismatch repair protein MutS2
VDKTFEDLEWGRLTAAIRARLAGPRPEERQIPLATTIEGARNAMRETAEALSFLIRGEPIPLDGIRDIRPSLSRIAREGSLDGPSLRDVEVTLRAASALRKFLGARRDEAPCLHGAVAIDPTLDRLADEIGAAIEPDGTVSDRASPDLRKLRTEVHNLRARLVSRLEEMIQKNAAILSDRFFTIRDGRYVLPLRTDAHESFPGIVHGTSGSGATLFVEPRAVVNQGNRLKVAEAEMQREEARILALLSDLVRERVAEVSAALDALEHADVRNGSARLARELEASVIEICDDAEVHLDKAKHPLLLLDGVEVVPSDLHLSPGTGLVVSGPNAGGKTVALKVLGLAALMVRAGLPFPAAEGSRIGFFDPVLTDVGDEQSIEKNLSTFSAHITNIARILDETKAGAMVLLDELSGGTDPAEGAALACAIAEAVVARGGLLAVTTHYEQLKALASTHPRLRNASVGFDVARLMPTFELITDVPGASSALSVASRFGIDESIVARAREVLPEQARNFESLVAELGAARAALDEERARLSEERQELARSTTKLEAWRVALEERDARRLSKEAEKVSGQLQSARDELRAARKRLKKKDADAEALSRAKKEIEAAARKNAEARDAIAPVDDSTDEGRTLSASELEVGTEVFVPRLKTKAEIVEAPRRGQVKIAAGAIRLTADVSDLRALPSEPVAAGAESSQSPQAPLAPPRDAPALRTSDNTLDVRGLRVDEALGMMDAFVDRLYGRSAPHAFIIHGHGTGALRDAIRAHLDRDENYVRAMRAGTREEGGDGITVITLR